MIVVITVRGLVAPRELILHAPMVITLKVTIVHKTHTPIMWMLKDNLSHKEMHLMLVKTHRNLKKAKQKMRKSLYLNENNCDYSNSKTKHAKDVTAYKNKNASDKQTSSEQTMSAKSSTSSSLSTIMLTETLIGQLTVSDTLMITGATMPTTIEQEEILNQVILILEMMMIEEMEETITEMVEINIEMVVLLVAIVPRAKQVCTIEMKIQDTKDHLLTDAMSLVMKLRIGHLLAATTKTKKSSMEN